MPDINIFVPPAQPVAFATSWAQVERLRAECDRAESVYNEAAKTASAAYPAAPALVQSWLEWQPKPIDSDPARPGHFLRDRLALALEQMAAAGGKKTEQYKRFASVLAAWRRWNVECGVIDDQHGLKELEARLDRIERDLAVATAGCLRSRPSTLSELAVQLALAIEVEPGVERRASPSALMAIVQGVIAEHAGAAAPTKH